MKPIQHILKNIEIRKGIKILYACETGSRAWGFPSPDSDFDVRFIYRHERDWYLSLSRKTDTVEHMEGDLDITGWDLRKSLLLLRKSNAALIERFQSPIVYYVDDVFRNKFKELIEQFYSPTAVFYHHYSLAQKFWEDLGDNAHVKLKSYFYLVRSMLSCYWIIKDKRILPMDLEGLMTIIDTNRREELRSLVQLKAGVGEKYLYKRNDGLDNWIKDLIKLLEHAKSDLGINNESPAALDDFFLKMLNDNVDN